MRALRKPATVVWLHARWDTGVISPLPETTLRQPYAYYSKPENAYPGNSAPATRSWIAAREAEELGRLGDETAALRALERAFTEFDFADPALSVYGPRSSSPTGSVASPCLHTSH